MELKSTLNEKKIPFTDQNLSKKQPMKTTKDTTFECFTYLPTTSRIPKRNATPEISTPLTTVLEKCLLSTKIQKKNYPRRTSTTP